MAQETADFQVSNQGSVWAFTPQTEAAREVTENMGLEDWQMWGGGGGFVVDHRPARQLVEQLQDEGFTVEF